MVVDIPTVLIAAVAGWQAVEVWHHGDLFKSIRARLEARQPWDLIAHHFAPADFRNRTNRLLFQSRRRLWKLGDFARDALLCPFCLSVWVGAAAILLMQSDWTIWIPGALCVSRLGNLFNDLTRSISRTPGRIAK